MDTYIRLKCVRVYGDRNRTVGLTLHRVLLWVCECHHVGEVASCCSGRRAKHLSTSTPVSRTTQRLVFTVSISKTRIRFPVAGLSSDFDASGTVKNKCRYDKFISLDHREKNRKRLRTRRREAAVVAAHPRLPSMRQSGLGQTRSCAN